MDNQNNKLTTKEKILLVLLPIASFAFGRAVGFFGREFNGRFMHFISLIIPIIIAAWFIAKEQKIKFGLKYLLSIKCWKNFYNYLFDSFYEIVNEHKNGHKIATICSILTISAFFLGFFLFI